jgi:hypothetical protein
LAVEEGVATKGEDELEGSDAGEVVWGQDAGEIVQERQAGHVEGVGCVEGGCSVVVADWVLAEN